jgi:aminopeptidase N
MASAEITRAETSQRARLVRVHSYEVALDLTRGAEVFGSVSVVRFDCAEPGAASYVDLVADAVHDITLNGVSLDPAAAWTGGRVTLPGLAACNELRVAADCAYAGSGTGMHRSADSADGGIYIYGKLAQAYARTAYACFDQPDLKAEFTFRVTAPEQWTVLSNQPAAGAPDPAGDGSVVWRFLPTPRLPTFTTTVVAGDYHVVTSSHTTPGGQQIPLELACRAGLADHLDPGALFEVTGLGLDFYTGVLGAYPFAKYGQVFVPELSCLASEDAGCVLVTEQFVYRSRVTAVMDEMRTGTLLHEMAHMWFGDLVTQQWWGDLWLSESFADFCEYEATSRLGRFPDAWSTFSVSEKAWGFAQDQLPSTHPVAANPATLSDAIANFDGISYAKGAAVLRQLAAYAGQENFFAGIRAYIAQHAYANAQLADLIAAVAASSGKDLAGWSKAWLETAGPNTLRGQFRTGGDGAFTEFAIVQDAPAQHSTLRQHRIAIGLYQRSGGALTRTHRVEADVAGARTVVPELAGLAQPDLILLNDDDTGYVIVRLDPRSLRTVTESIGELTDPAARAVCWNTVIDMVRQAELPVPVFMAMLAAGLPPEPSLSVLQALLTQAAQVLTQLADPQRAAAGKLSLADVAGRMLRSAQPASDRQLAWAQLLSWTATSADQLDLVAGLLDSSTAVPGLSVDAELRWSLLQRLAATGRADDASVDAELARDPTDAGRRNAAACRAAIPDARHKEAAWELLTSGRLGPESLAAVARGFTQPEQAHLLASYAGRYLTELEKIWATESGHLRVRLSELLFPYPAAAPALLSEIDDFLVAAPRDPALTRVLSERRDSVQRALRSRALPPPAPPAPTGSASRPAKPAMRNT